MQENTSRLFYRKDIILLVKPWLQSLYMVPKRSDSVMSILPYHEREELTFLKEKLKPGDVFIDVGAHLGGYTIPAAKLVGPNGIVIAIEPSPIFKYLVASILLNSLSNVVAINKAAYSSKAKLKFAYNPRKAGIAHILDDNLNDDFGIIEVEAETIDNIVKKYIPNKLIKCLKIDVEGAEVEVLKGAEQTLKKVDYIIIEARKDTIDSVFTFLEQKKFKLMKRREVKEGVENLFFVRVNGGHSKWI